MTEFLVHQGGWYGILKKSEITLERSNETKVIRNQKIS